MHKKLILSVLSTVFSGVVSVQAEDKITYADQVRPLLENKCFSCHNPDKKKGDLDLTSFAGAMAGSASGAIVSPGDAEGSKSARKQHQREKPVFEPLH